MAQEHWFMDLGFCGGWDNLYLRKQWFEKIFHMLRRHCSLDHKLLFISICIVIVSFGRYKHILLKKSPVFAPRLYLSPPPGDIIRIFVIIVCYKKKLKRCCHGVAENTRLGKARLEKAAPNCIGKRENGKRGNVFLMDSQTLVVM